MQVYRCDQSFYSRIVENNKIKNVLIDIFLILEEINFLVINFINVALAKKLASL